jgi:GNAT superfamily N-acetyltransferase
VIRPASASDVAGIRALMQSVPGFWEETWRSDVLERALASAETTALVHFEGTLLVGFACAHDVGFRAYLSALVVSPTAQGRGVGSRLLAELERRLAARGCAVVIADVWRDAEEFYRSQGWTPPAVVLLRKRLAAGKEVGTA